MDKQVSQHQQLLAQLGDAIYSLTKVMKSQQSDDGVCVSPALDNVILITGKSKTINVKQLAKYMQTTSGAVTQHIAALERLDAVSRVTSDKDRREVIVALTPKGQQMYHEIVQARLKLFTEVFSRLTDNELQTMHDLLVKVSQQQSKGDEL